MIRFYVKDGAVVREDWTLPYYFELNIVNNKGFYYTQNEEMTSEEFVKEYVSFVNNKICNLKRQKQSIDNAISEYEKIINQLGE